MSRLYRLITALSRFAPASVRAWVRGWVDVTEYHRYLAAQRDPFANEDPLCLFPESPCTLGILYEPWHYHKSYVAACREMRISYKLLDISVSDWMRVVKESGCDAFLVWPWVRTSVHKEMCDERMRIMEEDLGLTLYPTFKEVCRPALSMAEAISTPIRCSWPPRAITIGLSLARPASMPPTTPGSLPTFATSTMMEIPRSARP